MQFKFDAQQEYQIAAIEAVAGLLEGQPRVEPDLLFALGGSAIAAIPNRLDLNDAALLANLQSVQVGNGLQPDDALQCIEAEIETADGSEVARFPNFSVEMETGTGKTYVYLRTVLDLFRRFGLRKFIVVVPSVAVREGVLKTLEITKHHFEDLYGNLAYRFAVYDSENLTQVRTFALSDAVELLIMTIDSFNKASNVIRQSTDRLQGETPIHLIQAARPVLILDEPQNMESELARNSLALLDPLFALRYSATHRNPYNVVYRLTPYDAYRQGLVKRIEVAGITKEEDANQIFLRLDEIRARKNTVTARVTIHALMKTGAVKEKTVTVKPGDSLREKSGRPEYDGYEVEEINPGQDVVRFTNNVELRTGESRGADKEAIFDVQIRYAVEEHVRKQTKLKEHGVKVLSLFFIDRVDNYAHADGIMRQQFVRAFDDVKTRYADWRDRTAAEVQAAYFAEKRTKERREFIDTKGESKADEAAYDLIMRDKERLLSFEEPVSFIFSHSALREGWDNPNIFQICTLNQTVSEIKKRQEIGRGVRLAVDQTGARVHDEHVNVLTVVANQSYERYVDGLQQEIIEEFGQEGLPPKPANARSRGVSTLRKDYALRPEFVDLWDRIKQRTRYAVTIDTGKLLDDIMPAIDALQITAPRVTVTKAGVDVGDEDALVARQLTATKPRMTLDGRLPLPNLIDVMLHLLEYTTPPVRLTRRTLGELLCRTANKAAMVANPHEFATLAVRVIKERLADHLVNGIQYERIDDWYEMTRFETDVPSWEDYLVPAEKALYDHVVIDSQTERGFIEGLEQRDDVRMYVKLPAWFTLPTPIGEYNPDWAIIMEDRDAHGQPTGGSLLYLVRETKSTHDLGKLRPDERRKIACGTRHFAETLDVDYRVLTDARELP